MARISRAGRFFAALTATLWALAGCDPAPESPDGGLVLARVRPSFELATDPMDLGAVPFPDDLYLDETGHIALGRLPHEDDAIPSDFPGSLRESLAELDGFSTTSPVFFWFPPGSLDASSLPQSPSATTREDSPVFLVDADDGSSTRGRRVPVLVHYNPELGQLALRPYDGHPLVAGRRYAAVVTTAVLDDMGMPIGPSEGFARIRDADVRPEDALEGEAYDRYSPVLTSLASAGIPKAQVAALAVFTVQTVMPDLRDARALVWADDPPAVALVTAVESGPDLDALLGTPVEALPGLDVEGGVEHRSIGWLVHGTFESPWLVSDAPRVHGPFRRDSSGALISTRTESVPFTLTLPAGDPSRLRLLIFLHGLGGERSSMLAIADALAAAGYAVLAIDIPLHGQRASISVPDTRHNYGGGTGPDGFGDRVGNEIYLDFLGVVDEAGVYPSFHPSYPRDIFRQSVVDLMRAVRVLREGDWSAVQAQPGLETLGFDPAPIGFTGVSLGGIIGTVFVASEPEIGAAILNVTGGDLVRLVERSASFSSLFLPILLPKVGLDPAAYRPAEYPAAFHPELAIVQTLLDRGDSMSFAPLLATQERDVLFQMAEDDETVPNSATEALARAAGAQIVGEDPTHTDLSRIEAPASGNLELASSRWTRGLYRFSPATHGLLSQRMSSAQFAHPPEPPFMSMAATDVRNPVDAAVAQLVHFVESWQSGSAEIIAPAP
jgi:dienelactone hydrolase